MADNKTIPTDVSVESFLNDIEDEKKREDSFTILNLMKQVTQLEPKMWGTSIIGFGSYHYKYESGREGDFMILGFSPRKANLSLYNLGGFEAYEAVLEKLGKHKLGKGCLYIKRLEHVDMDVLKELIEKSFEHSKRVQDINEEA